MNTDAAAQTSLEPLVKRVTVPCTTERAFEIFTEQIAGWWPLSTHSVGGDDAVSVRIDGHVGGEIVETTDDGQTSVWGTVTAWEPPSRVAFTWHPGQSPQEATAVEVTFQPDGSSTLVTLTHERWANRPDGHKARQGYDSGWDTVLGGFVTSASR
jgi:uncharacterized protein YndB with AHSA1/START domain